VNEHAPAATDIQEVLTGEWGEPFGGVPPFDSIDIGAFEPALTAAMISHLREIDRIADHEEPPSFANTLEPLELAGQPLDRVLAVFGVWCLNMSTPEFRVLERATAPRLAAHADTIVQNEALFRRIEAVYESADAAGLSPEQRRLAWLHYTNYVRSGARLDAAAKERLSDINQRLAALFTQFNQNVLADEERHWLTLDAPEQLAGLSQQLVRSAAALAAEKGLTGKWVIANTRSSMEPFLTYADRRELREAGWALWRRRGDDRGDHDNHPLASEILALRAERARLLGYASHAHYRLEHAMARQPERALGLLQTVWPRALARVRVEVEAMRDVTGADDDFVIEPWDYRYYAEKVRTARYDLDESEVKAYLQLDNVREALFWVAGELFDFEFREANAVPVFHPDVRVWEVSDGAGAHVGLWYFDPFARPGKKSGAWMTAYRAQHRLDGITTLVSNNCNYVKPAAGEPVLISWDDATTLFHEFGHALHGLCSDVTYPSLSGTAVPRDFVEFPSQLFEHWLSRPEVLRRFALHWETGEPMTDALIERIERAATFNQGFATAEYLASALVDVQLHLAVPHAPDAPDTRVLEARALTEIGMPREVDMRHRTAHFQHAFGSDGYSAAYYSYLWADTLVADAFEAFLEAGDVFDPGVASRLREQVLAAGNTRDPADAYRAFRGRDADADALLRKRGFA
jgi:peptidyl-dipeptidase Dcp